ncbi:hypothetical protein [Vibrio owensii]|uniref:hypothetical protein n=1 Tax=Vibrio owensii TaxID=696485 RepID=UPI0018F1ECA9|nr:hypothetical protein [Vibrio owensii]
MISLNKIYKTIFGFALVSSFLSFTGNHHTFPVSNMFEFAVIVTAMLSPIHWSKDISLSLFLITTYVSIKIYFNFIENQINLIDFVISHKFIFYLAILLHLKNINFPKCSDFIRCYHFVLFAFAAKYFISVTLGINSRPTVFTENNFELLFLILLSLAKHTNVEKLNIMEMVTIVAIVVISGSRSGLGCLLFAIVIMSMSSKNMIKTIIGGVLIGGLSTIALSVTLSRMDGVDLNSIDRFLLLNGFFESIKDWSVIELLFGNFVVKPVPTSVCGDFWYYESLFSKSGSNVCYANIFHSFILRCLYDFGLTGLIVSFGVVWSFVTSNLPKRESVCAIGVIALNGLSVSSLNSVYCMLGLISILMTNNKENENTQFK